MKYLFWNILLMDIDESLRQASINAGDDDTTWRDLHWRYRWRIKISTASEWFHWWRWTSGFNMTKYKFRKWQHKHDLLCRCFTYNQQNGVHRLHCPKFRKGIL